MIEKLNPTDEMRELLEHFNKLDKDSKDKALKIVRFFLKKTILINEKEELILFFILSNNSSYFLHLLYFISYFFFKLSKS
ncbi:hypothetical protein QEW_2546 [Clostridioides difficile CD160]|nr:hypothetical protein QEW_2546 [Clostridioides difficile CD160]